MHFKLVGEMDYKEISTRKKKNKVGSYLTLCIKIKSDRQNI